MTAIKAAHRLWQPTRHWGIAWAAVALVCCLWLAYANSFNAAWQYDDFGNIINNPNVQMTELSWSQIHKAMNGGLDYQTVSRPLAYLSFALNHRFGGFQVLGYHIVNFLIHCLSALVLFLFVRDTLRQPIFKGRYDSMAEKVAWLAAALWALHPIQVTAVTYIVQRMASLAGFFYILSMYLYLKGRRAQNPKVRGTAYAMCAISVLCALLTKENAVLIGVSILIYDLIIIQGATKQNLWRMLGLTAGLLVVMGLIGLFYTDPSYLLEPLANRPFSLSDRLLTQPRVLFFYLSLLAMPMTSRMTILHDVDISHSLLASWQTGAAMGGLVGLVLLLLIACKRYPLLSFCGLFFLLNHVVEGSVFNLEMAYEHRNYIPSMFLFVVPAAGAWQSIAYFDYHKRLQTAIVLTAVLSIASFGYATHSYNRIFKSELTLWQHAVRRAPGLSLAHNNLGNIYWSMGEQEQAYKSFARAYSLDRYQNLLQKALVYHNLGLYFADHKQNYQQAYTYFDEAKKIYQGSPNIWYQTARVQAALGELSGASESLTTARERWPKHADIHYLTGLVRIKQGLCIEARQAAQEALDIAPDHLNALTVLAQSYRCQGDFASARKAWEEFHAQEPDNLYGILALIDLYNLEGRADLAGRFIERLRSVGGDDQLERVLDMAIRNGNLSPFVPDKASMMRTIQKRDRRSETSSDG